MRSLPSKLLGFLAFLIPPLAFNLLSKRVAYFAIAQHLRLHTSNISHTFTHQARIE
ncbi:hypothetical protein DSM100685_1677 [Bifidobacterium avesanii]|nr:hypothetical protein DSM100685_1677 [Bifidobacterium avesanii]